MATTVIDNKVVEMRFDNRDFEKNIQQSMLSLDKLKASLNMDSAKALDNLGRASNNFQLNGMTSAIETVQARFSALQVVGITVLQELTRSAMRLGSQLVSSFIEPIKSGGMNRALNIEQAKFQLEGLGVAWSEIEEDINYGVKDTAYGLDAAAKAAAQLTASGVTMGENMKASLRGISGVAAMTNATYDEISPIFTTVAGQGKLMTMQLRQLEARGLNAAATLGKALGKSEADIRQMVTDGKIDFQTFANAMDDAFGAHAKDANKTFTGAMSNVKAAMSRIGANFAQPYMENMRLIFVESIKALNNLNKALSPVVEDVTKIMEMFQKRITNFLSSTGLKNGTISIVNALRNAFYSLLLIAEPIRRGFRDIFPYRDLNKGFENVAKSLENFTSKLVISEETADKIRSTFKGVFAIFDILGQAFSALFRVIVPFNSTAGSILSTILTFTSRIGEGIAAFSEFARTNNIFEKAFSKVANTIRNASTIITDGINKVIEAFKNFKKEHIDSRDLSGFTDAFEFIKSKIPTMESVGDAIGKIFEGISNALKNVGPVLKSAASFIGDLIGNLLKSSSQALGPGNAFAALMNTFSAGMLGTLTIQIAEFLGMMSKQVKNLGGISPLLANFSGVLKQVQADIKADVLMRIAKAIGVLAGSLLVLSLIEPGRLAASIGAVELLIFTLSRFMDTLYVISSSGGVFKDLSQAALLEVFGQTLIKLGTAVLVLAFAVKVLAGIDTINLIQGMIALEILLKSLTDQAILMSSIDTKMMQGAGVMIAMAAAIRILASSVKALGELSLGDLIKGMVAVIILMKELSSEAILMSNIDTKMMKGAAVMIALAAAVRILAEAVKALSSLDLFGLIQGTAAVSVLILALAGFAKIASGSKNMLGLAVAMIAVAAAMKILVGVVDAFGKMDVSQLLQGGIALGVLLAALAAFSHFTSGGNLLVSSAAILILSAAIGSLTDSMEKLGSMSIGDLIKAFVTLAAVIGGFALAASLLSPLLPVMAALAGIITLLGVGVLALGAGVVALSAGLATLAGACTAVVANLGAILTIIAAVIPAVLTALANGILTFLAVFAANTGAVVDAIVVLGVAILNALIELTPKIVEAVIVLVKGLIDAIVQATPLLVQGALDFISGFLEGMTAGLPRLIQAMHDFAVTAINGFADSIRNNTPETIAAFDNLMDACITAISLWFHHFTEQGIDIVGKIIEGIKSIIDQMKSTGEEIVRKAKDGIQEGIKGVVQLGKDFVNGFIEGIKSFPGKVADAAKGLAQSALNAVQQAQDSNSPAKKTQALGRDFGDGYIVGIDDMHGGVEASAENMVNAALDPVKKGGEEAENSSRKTAQNIIKMLKDTREAAENNLNPVEAYMKRYSDSNKVASLSTNELKKEMNDLKNPASETNKHLKEMAQNEDNLAESTGKATKAGKEQKSFLETMKDTIENQINIFSKFEIKTGVTAQQMLDNMKSNIDGFASWSHRLATLAERGIDQALYKKLAEMGPNAYETVNAFVQMTDEQLQEANQLFATSMTLPQSQADIVQAGFTYAGEMANQGFSDALKDHMAAHEAAHGLGQAALDGINEALEVHSPSRATFKTGYNTTIGLKDGINDPGATAILKVNIRMVCRMALAEFRANMESSLFYEVGKNATMGLANGIGDSEATNAVLTKAHSIAIQVGEIMRKALDEESPSHVTEAIGKFASLGLAVGLDKGAKPVSQAARSVADLAVQGVQSAVDKINDFVELNLNPVITPILDLSYMESQIAALGTSFGVRSTAAGEIQNGSGSTASGSGVTYIQNNYSPKELSRIDVYRQTRNQLSMIGKVVKANA